MTSFVAFCEARGLLIEHLVSMRWVRCRTTDHPRKRNGAYWYEGRFGVAQNWATMESAETWFQDRESKSDPDLLRRLEASRASHERRRVEDAIRAALKAQDMLSRSIQYQHPYLDSKGLKDEKGNVLDQTLLVPMNDLAGRLVGLQTIEMEAGEWKKRMLFGTRAKGAVFRLNQGRDSILCEGYATGLSILRAVNSMKLNCSVVVCFSAGNLTYIGKQIPGSMICADNDLSGTGQKAAMDSGCVWTMPDEAGADFNDLMAHKGILAVQQKIRDLYRLRNQTLRKVAV